MRCKLGRGSPITKYKEFLFVYYEMSLEEKIFA